MPHPAAVVLFAFAAADRAAAAEQAGEPVTIRKVGYPEARVGGRTACGQRSVNRLHPDYFLHVVFEGFREGECSQIGYTKFEETREVGESLLPFLPRRNLTVAVYSRDPTALDVAGCVGRECAAEVSALGSSSYVKDVAHCVSPAFGPCVPKAWDCLGDDVCRSALQCLPRVARTCGRDVWTVMTDPVEREKVTCLWQCGNSTSCILEKCGKVALECLTGADSACHRAVVCLPDEVAKCSVPAAQCLVSKDGVCRENLACVAKGANVCADPAVNVLTDASVAGLVACANEKCPAPADLPDGEPLQASELGVPPHYPEQLACMGTKCAGTVAKLLGDKDVGRTAKCIAAGVEDCSEPLWSCLGDKACQGELQCWLDSAVNDTADIWKMATDPSERSFGEDLVSCVSECGRDHHHAATKALCVAGKCGERALKCLGDSTCRSIFTDLPKTFLRCAPSSLKDPTFKGAAMCAVRMAESCGPAGVELVRDKTLADIVTCNAQCTRPPQPPVAIVV